MVARFVVFLAAVAASAVAEITIDRPNESQLNRPCSDLSLQCIRNVFNYNGWCVGAGPAQNDPLTVNNVVNALPTVNVTAKDLEIVFSNLGSARITEFFINPNTDSVVLAVQFNDVEVNADAEYRYHRSEKEDIIVTVPDTYAFYGGFLITALTSGMNKFDKDSTNTYTDIQQDPEVEFPGIDQVTDVDIANLFEQVYDNLHAVIEELFVNRSPLLIQYIISTIICNN